MVSPSELDVTAEPIFGKSPPRLAWKWQPRNWNIVGCSLLLVAVASANAEWDSLWTKLSLYLGVVTTLWGFSGGPVRELSGRYKAAQAAITLAVLLPPWFPGPGDRLNASCFTQPGRSLTAYLAVRADPRDQAIVIDYGDGSTHVSAKQDGIEHVYAKPGTYHARITVVQQGRTQSVACALTVR